MIRQCTLPAQFPPGIPSVLVVLAAHYGVPAEVFARTMANHCEFFSKKLLGLSRLPIPLLTTVVVVPSLHGLPLKAPSTQKKCRISPGRMRAT